MKRYYLLLLLCIFPLWLIAQKYEEGETYYKRATYYHNRFENRKTTSGEIFNQNKYTAAHKTIKLGTYVKITNQKNNHFVIVKVNDRCPKNGIIDLSYNAAKRLNFIKDGVTKVKLEILPDSYKTVWEAQDSIIKLLDSMNEKNITNYEIMQVYKQFLSKDYDERYGIEVAIVNNNKEVDRILETIPEELSSDVRIYELYTDENKQKRIIIGYYESKKQALDNYNIILKKFPKAKFIKS